MDPTKPLTIVFDGYCKACTKVVAFLGRRDKAKRLNMVPNQAPDALQTYSLTQGEVQRAVWAIEADGTRYEGAAAANRILASLGGFWGAVASLYRIRPIRWLEDTFYHWFSANRHHFGWMWRVTAYCDQPGSNCLPYQEALEDAKLGPSPLAIGGGGGGPVKEED